MEDQSNTTNPKSDGSNAHAKDVGQNSSPVQLDGGRVARLVGKPGDLCAICGGKLHAREFARVKDHTKSTRRVCYPCLHDKLWKQYQRDIQAKDEAIAALEAKLVKMSAEATERVAPTEAATIAYKGAARKYVVKKTKDFLGFGAWVCFFCLSDA